MTESEFNNSINEHSAALLTHALRFTKDEGDAADLVQDTLIKAIRFRESYREGTNLKGWLYTILRNTFLNTFRKEKFKRDNVTQTDEITSSQLSNSASTNLAEGSFVMNDIRKALDMLPEMYRTPFVSYFEGYKYQEIADTTGIPLGTVKTRIHMAREMLKKFLKIYKLKDGTGHEKDSGLPLAG